MGSSTVLIHNETPLRMHLITPTVPVQYSVLTSMKANRLAHELERHEHSKLQQGYIRPLPRNLSIDATLL
jgi:hypothetical protein